jgi:hypothetical protein
MPWNVSGTTAGAAALDEIDTTQKFAWGKEIDGLHETYGAGKFVYVKGVSGGFAGAVVLYQSSNGVTIISATSGLLQAGSPVAVLLAALDATTKYGWAQVSGDAVIKKTAVAVPPATTRTDVFLSATAGRIMPTSVATRRIMGARWTNTASVLAATSTAVVHLNRPHIQAP